MGISDRVRILQAKGYLAQAMGNLLEVIANQVSALDSYDEDTDRVISAAESALDDLHSAMDCIVGNGERRGTITDRDYLGQCLMGAYECIDDAIREMGTIVHVPLEITKIRVVGAGSLCDIRLPLPQADGAQPGDDTMA